jgi:hypothetical protein
VRLSKGVLDTNHAVREMSLGVFPTARRRSKSTSFLRGLLKMRRLTQTLLAGLLVATLGDAAHAALIASHSGSTDPTTEGWILDSYGAYSVSGGADEEAHWYINDANSSKARYLYNLDSTILGDSSGWTMTARVKVNSANWVDGAKLGVLDSTSWWQINLCADPTGYMGAYAWNSTHGFGSQLSPVNPSLAYHTYQIVYNAVGDAADYYMDGTFLGGALRSSVPPGYGIYRAEWGDGSDGAIGADSSRWSFVSFETGQHVVPEPSMITLLVVGLLSLLAYAWRKRK